MGQNIAFKGVQGVFQPLIQKGERKTKDRKNKTKKVQLTEP